MFFVFFFLCVGKSRVTELVQRLGAWPSMAGRTRAVTLDLGVSRVIELVRAADLGPPPFVTYAVTLAYTSSVTLAFLLCTYSVTLDYMFSLTLDSLCSVTLAFLYSMFSRTLPSLAS